MSRIDQVFAELRQAQRKVLMPFLVAGDPTLKCTESLLREFGRMDLPFCELGFPYSDPIADGPVIQAAYTRALSKRTSAAAILETVQSIPEAQRPVTIGMVSMAIIHRSMPALFLRSVAQAGFGGLIVPDLPYEEAAAFAAECRNHDLSWIPLIAPTTSDDRARRIIQLASGFIYYISVTGITGERAEIPEWSRKRLRWLRSETDLPICVGFGVSTPAQVASLADDADGIIVGSAIVRRIAATTWEPDIVPAVTAFVTELSASLH